MNANGYKALKSEQETGIHHIINDYPKGKKLHELKKESLPIEQNRRKFTNDLIKLIDDFKNKLQMEKYFEHLNKKEKEKRAVETIYAYIIQFILYKILVDNGPVQFNEEFNSKVKKIHECIKNKRYKDFFGIICSISDKISENIYRPFTKEQDFIPQKLLELYQKGNNKLSDISPWLDIFDFIKKYNFVGVQNEILGNVYENYLKKLYAGKEKGQYFTDPAVVNFMLQQIGFTTEKIQQRYKVDEDSISLIDPSCGSGAFLYSAVDSIIRAFSYDFDGKSKRVEKIIANNIFGLDSDEFSLCLAEMSILMRMTPLITNEKYNNPDEKKIKAFHTEDSITEFMKTTDLKIPRRRFDYVIGNPPYVGYNECSKQKIPIFELINQGKVRLNNIYGVNLHSIPGKQKKYAPKPNLYSFFIALGISLLKDNGRLCHIVPQTLLTARDLDVIRYHLAKFTTIEKIITFGGKMFSDKGIKQNKSVATSSLIFVVRNEKPTDNHQVEIINYKNLDTGIKDTIDDNKTDKKTILQNALLQKSLNWNFIKQDIAFLDFYDEYLRKTDDISIYYDHVMAEQHFKSIFYFDKGLVYPKNKIRKKTSAKK